jgi:aspartyl-tRNA(Asn)/glutamyl-tRNA(Gln) amidotransferase subunit C
MVPVKITREEIKYVADLARVELQPEEMAAMAGQLDRILQYVDKLSGLDTTGIEPTFHALAIHNVFRKDAATGSLPRKTALANGPEQNGETFIVPRVL